MAVAVVTGSGGLVGFESVRYFTERGFDVIGLENDMRSRFFGAEASTQSVADRLAQHIPTFTLHEIDIRDRDAIDRIFRGAVAGAGGCCAPAAGRQREGTPRRPPVLP